MPHPIRIRRPQARRAAARALLLLALAAAAAPPAAAASLPEQPLAPRSSRFT